MRPGEVRADVNSAGLEHRTALHWAVYENKLEAVNQLLHCGADVDAKTSKSRTPLHIACILSEFGICQSLLQAGASVDAQDKDNNTPTHYTAYYSNGYLLASPCIENAKILKLLLAYKPDITRKNKRGQTPIDVTSSKTIIALFWRHMSGKLERDGEDGAKVEAETGIEIESKARTPLATDAKDMNVETSSKTKAKMLEIAKKPDPRLKENKEGNKCPQPEVGISNEAIATKSAQGEAADFCPGQTP